MVAPELSGKMVKARMPMTVARMGQPVVRLRVMWPVMIDLVGTATKE